MELYPGISEENAAASVTLSFLYKIDFITGSGCSRLVLFLCDYQIYPRGFHLWKLTELAILKKFFSLTVT